MHPTRRPLLCWLACATTGLTASADPVSFSAMGCGPYKPDAEEALVRFIRRENAERSSDFIVHLGDIVSGAAARRGELQERYYAKIRGYPTNGNTIPTYIVPGDNEWNDCLMPDAHWVYWVRHLRHLESHFEVPWKTIHQPEREENFAFLHKGVLFLGINLVGGTVHDKAEWDRRFAQNSDWIGTHFAGQKEKVRAAVVMCQANPIGFGKKGPQINATFKPFVNRFIEHATAFAKPVLFLHADGHKWLVDRPFGIARNVTRVQVDLIRPEFPPVQITVTEDATFAFDRRKKNTAWVPAKVKANPKPGDRAKASPKDPPATAPSPAPGSPPKE